MTCQHGIPTVVQLAHDMSACCTYCGIISAWYVSDILPTMVQLACVSTSFCLWYSYCMIYQHVIPTLLANWCRIIEVFLPCVMSKFSISLAFWVPMWKSYMADSDTMWHFYFSQRVYRITILNWNPEGSVLMCLTFYSRKDWNLETLCFFFYLHIHVFLLCFPCFAGIILVHDLTNRKSQQNLQKWLAEVISKDGSSKSRQTSFDDFDPEQFVGLTQVIYMS
jgi:hypothetical protein